MESVIWKKILLPPSLWVIRSSCVQFTAFHIKGRIHGFTGTVQILRSRRVVCASSAYATFEPGARAAWHSHPLGQALIIMAGVGRGQGGPIQEVRPGGAAWFLRVPNTGTEPRPVSPRFIFPWLEKKAGTTSSGWKNNGRAIHGESVAPKGRGCGLALYAVRWKHIFEGCVIENG